MRNYRLLKQFLVMTPKEKQAVKQLVGFHQIRNFCVSKNIIKKVKNATHRMRENICIFYISILYPNI